MVGLQTARRKHELVLGHLRGRNDDGIGRGMVELFLVAHHVVVLVKDGRLEHRAVIVDSADGLAAHDLGTVELGQLDLIIDSRDVA